MYEFDSVSVSSFEASSLASKLTEKSSDGWDVVAIVPSGSDVTAYLRRQSETSTGDDAASTDSTSRGDDSLGSAATAGAVGASTGATAAEPAGWGSAPEAASSTQSWGSSTSNDSGASWGSGASNTGDTTGSSWGSDPSSAGGASGWGGGAASTASAPAATSTPSVPPGWYADPAGRYELRYWDGSAWTEHVSRAGQQYTDPPVA